MAWFTVCVAQALDVSASSANVLGQKNLSIAVVTIVRVRKVELPTQAERTNEVSMLFKQGASTSLCFAGADQNVRDVVAGG